MKEKEIKEKKIEDWEKEKKSDCCNAKTYEWQNPYSGLIRIRCEKCKGFCNFKQ